MIGEGAHFEFIAWAYAGVGVLTVALIAFVIWEARQVRARLEALDKAGVRRRSAGSSS